MQRLLMPFISSQRRGNIRKYKCEVDKILSLYSEILVMICLAKALVVGNDDLKFDFNEHGKPFCK